MATYDPRVYQLACLFLSDTPKIDCEKNRIALAAHIQLEIEAWITFEEEEHDLSERKRG